MNLWGTLIALASLLSSAALGWLTVRLLWPSELRRQWLLRATLAVGVGAGLSSLLYFANLVVAGAATPTKLLGSEIATGLVLLALQRQSRSAEPTHADYEPPAAARGYLTATLAATACAIGSFVLASCKAPHGVADAIGIWNLRARLLFGSGEAWPQAFAPELAITHPDYPLLVPGFAARTWECLGTASPLVPAALALAMTFGTVALLGATLNILRGRRAGCVAALALLGFPAFVAAGPTQNADVPLSFFLLATIALIALHDFLQRSDQRLLVLAGLTAGLAAWTKNEGLLFVVALPVLRAINQRKNLRAVRRELPAMAAGLALPITAQLWFKTQLVPANDLMAQAAGGQTLTRATDPNRYLQIAQSFTEQAWGLGPIMLLSILAYVVLVRQRRLALAPLAAGSMLLGYFTVYLLTSENLSWHLASSAQRLLLQVLPLAVLWAFSNKRQANA